MMEARKAPFVLTEGRGQRDERTWGQPLSAGVAREVRTSSQGGAARLPPPPKGDVSLESRRAAAGRLLNACAVDVPGVSRAVRPLYYRLQS